MPNETGIVVTRDARQHPRHKAACAAHLSTLDAVRDGDTGAPYFLVTQGATLDIGEGGLGMTVDAQVVAGSRVLVDVELDGGRTLECLARVVWTASDGDREYAGLSFDEPQPGLARRL